jgi:uncharacterized protein YdhG (YjbR/CyaY superfamily)
VTRQAYKTIDEYIAACPRSVQGRLREIRRLIRELVPDAVERISYRMPTFYLNGNLVYFAAHTSHIGFYPTSSGIERFEAALARYEHSKGAVRFPLEEPLPLDLIARIVRFRAEENRSRKKQ